MEHAGHKSKSGQPVRPYSTSSKLFLLFVQQTCQNIVSMNAWIGFQQDYRFGASNMERKKTTEKLLQSYK